MLTIENLSVAYKGAVALQDISLDITSKEPHAVLGPNGAGKTTLLRAISGTLSSHAGRIVSGAITYEGEVISNRSPASIVSRGIVHVPEGRRVFARMTVDDNLRAGGVTVRKARQREISRNRVFDLFPVLRKRQRQQAGLLSGGEQQMLAIGRALMASPRMIMFDEPSLGLAPVMITRIASAIREIAQQEVSIILIEQNATLALDLTERCTVISAGRLRTSSMSKELKQSDTLRNFYFGGSGEVSKNG